MWTVIWEEVRRTHPEGTLLEVEHVKALRPKKEKREMTLFENFVTTSNERTDEMTKDVAMLDGGRWHRSEQHNAAEKRVVSSDTIVKS